ncbi:MAG: FAD-dependent oxidoreductase, partial [Bacillota bacterium]|nr:FAD-dependent oxidoreductase [Bacillota bacterium]
MTKYLIIGNSGAGVFAADAIRQRDKEGEITILSTEREMAYSRCLTTYYVSGQINKCGMFIRPGDHYEKNRITFWGGVRVTAIDSAAKTVTLSDGKALPYDKLLIASGASATKAPIPGAGDEDIHVMRTMADAEALLTKIKEGKNRVAVLGGGLVSLKTAGALGENGAKVTVVVTSQNILSQQFDKIGADLIMTRLKKNNVDFVLGASAQEVSCGDDGAKRLKLTNGKELPVDVIFMGKGVNPNTDFLPPDMAMSGKGIKTDRHMATNLPDIYAAGDVATSFDKVTGEEALYAIWPAATEQGEIAGANMTGESLVYQGAVSMNSLHFFGLKAICGGDSRGLTPEATVEYELCEERSFYRKCVFSQGRLVGFILVGAVDNAGILMANLGNSLSFQECL